MVSEIFRFEFLNRERNANSAIVQGLGQDLSNSYLIDITVYGNGESEFKLNYNASDYQLETEGFILKI